MLLLLLLLLLFVAVVAVSAVAVVGAAATVVKRGSGCFLFLYLQPGRVPPMDKAHKSMQEG